MEWVKHFVLHSGKKHRKDMGAQEVEVLLTHLGAPRQVSASTQNQAKSALLFLYKEVLAEPLPWLEGIGQERKASAGRPDAR